MSVLIAPDGLVFAVTSKALHKSPVILVSQKAGRCYENKIYLAFGIRPEVDPTADEIVQRGIRSLVQQPSR